MIVIDQERRMVMARGTRYSQEFKEDAVRYRLEHPEVALRKCAENLGISESALKNQQRNMKELFLLVVPAITQVMRQKKSHVCNENYAIQRMHLKY